jgi:hypothetical protein
MLLFTFMIAAGLLGALAGFLIGGPGRGSEPAIEESEEPRRALAKAHNTMMLQ